MAEGCSEAAPSCDMSNQTWCARRAKGTVALALSVALVGCARRAAPDTGSSAAASVPPGQVSSAEWLALLPDGAEKRRFILDCTGCGRRDSTDSRARASNGATSWLA
jgi:hypothetical protein